MLHEDPLRARQKPDSHGLNVAVANGVARIPVASARTVRGGHLEQLVADVRARPRLDHSTNEMVVRR